MNALAQKYTPWLLLFGRTILFFTVQALFAFGLVIISDPSPWDASASLWMISVAISNLVCLAAMAALYRAEGKNYWDIFKISRSTVKADLLSLVLLTLIMAPIGVLPNILLGKAIFGSSEAALTYLIRPLPVWIAIAGIILFPITQGATELGTYFFCVMPRISKKEVSEGIKPSLSAYLICALMLGFQHIAAPFHFDAKYILWRGLMFVPFALFIGWVLRWRPRLMPYVAVIHTLMDLSFAAMVLPYIF